MGRLQDKVERLDSMIDTQRVISGEKNSPKEIQSYFTLNRLPYRVFHSRDGFMHFRVTRNGTFSDDDIYYQPETISAYIPPFARVLELGPGQGANLRYLATRHPDSFFCGVDLSPAPLRHPPRNLRVLQQDYSDLSRFPDAAFDTAYAIETLVYSSQKEKVFQEVRRVLKPGGAFIVYDYALPRKYEDYDPLTQKAVSLISKGGAAALIESEEEWEAHFTANGFRRENITDLSAETLPDLKRLQHKAAHILNHPRRTKAVFRLLPAQFVNNIILGYLGYDACREGVIAYKEWIFRTEG